MDLAAAIRCVSIILVLTSAACSPPAGSVPADAASGVSQVLSYRAADRQAKLEDGGRQETKLLWYTSLSGDILKALPAAFQQRYPGISVEVFRGGSNEVLARILEEHKARQSAFDVLESSRPVMYVLREQALLAPYYSPEAQAYPDLVRERADQDLDSWISLRESYMGLAYNTSLIRQDAAPRTYEDLLRPELRGKMTVIGPDPATRLLGNMLTHRGEELVRAFGQQQVTVQLISGPPLVDLIASGEVPISPTAFRNHVRVAAARGAPVAWVPLEPVTTSTGSVAISASTRHPHAAALFADFLLGEDGRRIYKEFGYASPAVHPGFERWDPERGYSTAEYDRIFDRWAQLMKTHLLSR